MPEGTREIRGKWILALSLPNIIILLLFFVAPLVLILSTSFYPGKTFSLSNYVQFFTQSVYYNPLLRTVEIATIVTLLTLVIGYPVAYYISKSKRLRGFLLTLVVFPLMVGLVVESFGWIILLGRNGVVNNVLISLGLIGQPVPLLFNLNGIIIGLVHMELPFMILALVASLSKIDNTLVQAAQNLGAGRSRTFFTVILPLSIPGVLAGTSVVFSSIIGVYVIPALLGGGYSVLSTLMADKILSLLNWSAGSTVGLVILIVGVASLLVFAFIESRIKYYGAIA